MLLMVAATGRLTAIFGIKLNIAAGMVFLVASLLLLAQAPTDGAFVLHVLPASLLAAVGMSLAYIPAMIASTASAQTEDSGLASGLVNTTYQVGSALGLAAMTAVAQSYTEATGLAEFNDGFHAAFYGAAVVAVAGGLAALALIRSPRQA
jgi:MFS family permease